jgi:hypothetical protein
MQMNPEMHSKNVGRGRWCSLASGRRSAAPRYKNPPAKKGSIKAKEASGIFTKKS